MAVRSNAPPSPYDEQKDATQATTQATAQADTAANPPAQPQDGGDPYKNPTGFVGFDQYFNANAGAAKKSANDVNNQVQTQANAANAGLAQAYAGFQKNVGTQESKNAAGGDGGWTDEAFSPGAALEQQYKAAEGARDALGSAGGIQALTKGTGLGAALTQRAGAGQFQQTQSHYAELEKAFGNAQTAADHANEMGAQQSAEDYGNREARGQQTQSIRNHARARDAGPSARADSEDIGPGDTLGVTPSADAGFWDRLFGTGKEDNRVAEDPYRAEWEREQAARGKGELVARNPNDP